MPKFQKTDTIEARTHTGLRILVVSDEKGEQWCTTGYWLIGTERGKITVKTDAQFKEEGWQEVAEPEVTEELPPAA